MKYTLSKKKTERQKLEDDMIIFGWVLLAIVSVLGLAQIV
jgi:hypothetical protein